MRPKFEIETDTALGILTAMAESIERLEGYWPASRRGSNCQRVLDQLKGQRAAAEQCCRDALAALETQETGEK